MFKGICSYFFLIALLLITESSCSTIQPLSKSDNHSDVLSGTWDVDFNVGNTTMHSTMTLKQDGSQFFGEGADANNLPFSIVNGQISGNQLDFFKKYSSNPPTTVEYRGVVSQVNDPDYQGSYLAGTYLMESNSGRLSGNWRAQLPSKLKPVATAPQPSQPVATTSNDKLPNLPVDLSGKWNAAYEYNFGIVHSIIFLEQKKGTITGHGIDTGTREKFVIEKGWYKCPNLVLVRSYKKKQGAKSDRNITFKAAVSMINDSDYKGPYLNGKTQGGGSWEAQLAP